jgi:hypothetical protein
MNVRRENGQQGMLGERLFEVLDWAGCQFSLTSKTELAKPCTVHTDESSLASKLRNVDEGGY